MRQRLVLLSVLACLLCGPSSASAQDPGAVGVTMGYPSSVGVIWHVAERFAIRPEVSFSTSTSEAPSLVGSLGGGPTISTSGSTTTSTAVGIGISGLFYIGKWDALRTYVAPRFVYSRNSATSESTSERFIPPTTPFSPSTPVVITTTTKSIGTSKSGAGLFGAAYSLHEHFGVFGEVGFGYTTSGSSSTSTPARDFDISLLGGRSHGWSARTGVGVVFYF